MPPRGRRGRPSNAERAQYGRGGLRAYLARLRIERLLSGIVQAYWWEGRLYCTTDCILAMDGRVWADTPAGKKAAYEIEEYEYSDVIPQSRGTWNLSRYVVMRFYQMDVEHFRCPACRRPLQVRLSAEESAKRRAEYLAREKAKRKAYRETAKQRRAAVEAEWSPERRASEEQWRKVSRASSRAMKRWLKENPDPMGLRDRPITPH